MNTELVYRSEAGCERPDRVTLGRRCKNPRLVAVVISAFGPYIVPGFGLRTEHLLIYFLAFWSVTGAMLGSNRHRLRSIPRFYVAVWVILLTQAVWTLLVTACSDTALSSLAVLAGLEGFLQPVAISAIVFWEAWGRDEPSLMQILDRTIVTTLVFLMLNTVLSVVSMHIDTWPVVRCFVSSWATSATTIWETARSIGRHTGIFNQPLEAGLAYSVGIIGWVYWVLRDRRTGLFSWCLMLATLIGGLLSVSKVFILGGLPLGVLCYVLLRPRGRRLLPRFGWLWVMLGVLVISRVTSGWSGYRHLSRLFEVDATNLIEVFSAGRLGSANTTMKEMFRRVWQHAPFHGFGLGATMLLDNAYLEFFYSGGLFSLALYCALIGVFVWVAALGVRRRQREGFFLMALTSLIIASGLGGGVLTLNRGSVPLWVFVLLMSQIIVGKRKVFNVPNKASRQKPSSW